MPNRSAFSSSNPANTIQVTWATLGVIHIRPQIYYVKDIINDNSAEGDVIYCSDTYAMGINEAIRELDNPNKRERFTTMEDFLRSLG